MTEHTFALAPFYQGWDGYQHHLVHALAPLSAEQLALRPVPHLRSIGTIATHIIGARARWLHYVLREGDENLVSLSIWDHPDMICTMVARSRSRLVCTVWLPSTCNLTSVQLARIQKCLGLAEFVVPSYVIRRTRPAARQ